MANTTPTRMSNSIESRYSPVKLDQSSSLGTAKNLTGLPRVAKDIVADLYNSIQKWNDYHIQGASTIQKIVLLKSNSTRKFPIGLEELVKELQNIMSKLTMYSNSLAFLSTQMEALIKLHKQETPLFFTLSVQELNRIIEDIAKAYKSEFMVKQYVLENIGHSKSKNEAMFHGACWIHQQYITSKVNLKLETILTETGHRQIQ